MNGASPQPAIPATRRTSPRGSWRVQPEFSDDSATAALCRSWCTGRGKAGRGRNGRWIARKDTDLLVQSDEGIVAREEGRQGSGRSVSAGQGVQHADVCGNLSRQVVSRRDEPGEGCESECGFPVCQTSPSSATRLKNITPWAGSRPPICRRSRAVGGRSTCCPRDHMRT